MAQKKVVRSKSRGTGGKRGVKTVTSTPVKEKAPAPTESVLTPFEKERLAELKKAQEANDAYIKAQQEDAKRTAK